MSELTPHTDNTPTFLPPRDEYAQITDLATRLSGTAFVPSGLRGDRGEANPPAVLAAMLTGRELGLAPMESLRSIHMIEGKPTLSAEATMKLAQEAGNLLIVTETTRERCTVKYRNASWPDDEPARELTFDLEDAELAGLTGRAMWNKYPRAMLRSRAITEAARAGGLLSGSALAYTAEELTDDGDVADGTVEEAVLVESISPDDADEDELETRRQLHRRAAAAYRRATELDEDTASTAWAAASAGLGANPWAEADLEVLKIRVGDLERVVAQLEDEHGDEDDDGGPEAGGNDDGPDGGTDGPDDAPAPETATQDDEEEADPTAGVCPECQEIAHDRDCPLVGDGRPTEDDELPDAEEEPPLSGDELAQLAPRERLVEIYGELNVAQVGALLRTGETDLETPDGGTLRVVLPRDEAGGVLAAYELVEELEAEHHDPTRKTVRGALESAGWTPKGRKRLHDARARAAMGGPDAGNVPSGDVGKGESGEDDEAGTTTPDEARAAQEATQSVPEVDAMGDLTLAELLDVAGDLVEQLEPGDARRFRDRLGELITEAPDGVPDRDQLAGMVRHARRLADQSDGS